MNVCGIGLGYRWNRGSLNIRYLAEFDPADIVLCDLIYVKDFQRVV